MIPEIMFLKSSWLTSERVKYRDIVVIPKLYLSWNIDGNFVTVPIPSSPQPGDSCWADICRYCTPPNFRWWSIRFVDFPQIFGVSNIDSLRSSFHKFWLNWKWFLGAYFSMNISNINSSLAGLEGSSYIMIYHLSIIST